MLLRHNLRARPRLIYLLVRQLRTQPLPDYQESNYVESNGLATPREVFLFLRVICWLIFVGTAGTVFKPVRSWARECEKSTVRSVCFKISNCYKYRVHLP